MILDELCPPALIYVVFTITHIIIDMFKNLYNLAFIKFMVMIIFTLLLNILCKQGLTVVSWVIVFIPFMMMTIITSMVLFTFGLSPSKDNLDYKVKYPDNEEDKDELSKFKDSFFSDYTELDYKKNKKNKELNEKNDFIKNVIIEEENCINTNINLITNFSDFVGFSFSGKTCLISLSVKIREDQLSSSGA